MSLRVALVDDEPVLCKVLGRILTLRGMRVFTFTNPDEALTYLRSNPVDVLVCDYRMPEMTGLELLEQIGRDVPTFLISGDLDIVKRLSEHPKIDAVFAKPVPPETLIDAIRSIQAERAMQRDV